MYGQNYYSVGSLLTFPKRLLTVHRRVPHAVAKIWFSAPEWGYYDRTRDVHRMPKLWSDLSPKSHKGEIDRIRISCRHRHGRCYFLQGNWFDPFVARQKRMEFFSHLAAFSLIIDGVKLIPWACFSANHLANVWEFHVISANHIRRKRETWISN